MEGWYVSESGERDGCAAGWYAEPAWVGASMGKLPVALTVPIWAGGSRGFHWVICSGSGSGPSDIRVMFECGGYR